VQIALAAASVWYAGVETVGPHHAGVPAIALLAAFALASYAALFLAHAITDAFARAVIAISRASFSPRTPAWNRRKALYPTGGTLSRSTAALVATLTFILMMQSTARAHVVCGDRVFPTTLTMDDPGVSDEMSLPTIQLTPTPFAQSNSYGYEWDKTITEDLGFAVNGDYITQRNPNQHLVGWDNITVTLKDQHPCIERHTHQEFVWSVGVIREIPGTGSKQLRDAGVIDSVGNTAPTFYFGKGLGDLTVGYLRPLAITGEVSRVFSDSPGLSPSAWNYAASLQYSMPYMQQHIKALHIPQFLTRLTPLVEVAMTSPDMGSPTGTISPGVLYDANTWQLGAEAVIPANGTTRQGQGTGFIIQYHEFLDTFYKSWFGRPIINRNLWQ
jgi:hypothetical protein